MEPYEKIKQLRNTAKKTTYDISNNTGIPQSTISKIENNKRKLDSETLKQLSDYFNISYDFLLNDSEIDSCPICGLTYSPFEKEDFEEHKIIHNNFLNFPDKELFLTYKDREIKKKNAYKILQNNNSSTLEKVDSVIKLYQCWFARSLETQKFNINHPLFNEYVAMLLNRSDSKKDLPEPVYKLLVEKYGLKEGIVNGESYAPLKKVESDNSKDENKLLENYRVANDEGKKMILSYSNYVSQNYVNAEVKTGATKDDEFTIAKNKSLEARQKNEQYYKEKAHLIPKASHDKKGDFTEEDYKHDDDLMMDDDLWND